MVETYLLNSPSVIDLIPASRCICTISLMAASSVSFSSSIVAFFCSRRARFCRSSWGRLREPMWSARKGGFKRKEAIAKKA